MIKSSQLGAMQDGRALYWQFIVWNIQMLSYQKRAVIQSILKGVVYVQRRGYYACHSDAT
jgi:hypothetical protein